MKAVFDLAKKYYPKYWNKERLDVLLAKKKLTQEEYDEIVKTKYSYIVVQDKQTVNQEMNERMEKE